MDAIALHLEVRNALSISDELGRHEHALGNDVLAGHLAALRTSVDQLERIVGRSHEEQISPNPTLIDDIERQLHRLREHAGELPDVLHPRLNQLLAALDRIVFAELRPEAPVPAKPLFEKLPLERVVPQDVHSVMDYVSAAAYLVSAGVARTRRGRAVGMLLGSSVFGVSLATDYRLSISKTRTRVAEGDATGWLGQRPKTIPIELHELLDHASGATAITAPLLLGYIKKDPIAAAIQIFTGCAAIAMSLVTDYRAHAGVGRALRSNGGPGQRERLNGRRARRRKPECVPEVQRLREGFAGPSYIPSLPI